MGLAQPASRDTPRRPRHPHSRRFSPDGRLLAVGYPHGRSHVWSTATWKPVTRPLVGDVGEIRGLAISPDGRTLVTGSLAGTVRLWDIETQQAVGAPLPGPAAAMAPSRRTSRRTGRG